MTDCEVEVLGLTGSLVQVQQVLEDLLDYDRMEQGLLRTTCQPFVLHACIRSVMNAFQLLTAQKGIDLRTELDPKIDDRIASMISRAFSSSLGSRSDAAIEQEGTVSGDEMRCAAVPPPPLQTAVGPMLIPFLPLSADCVRS